MDDSDSLTKKTFPMLLKKINLFKESFYHCTEFTLSLPHVGDSSQLTIYAATYPENNPSNLM